MEITSTKQIPKFIKMLVYGEAGVGKTVLSATAPNPIIISAEKGLLSLADKDVPVIEVDSLKGCLEVYDYLNEQTQEYDTIVLDSLSEIGEALLREFKKGEKDPRKAYMKMADELDLLTKAFRDLDRHVVFIAKQELNKDEYSGKTTYRPSAPGQSFTSNMAYLFDEVLCMRIGKEGKEIVRYLQTQPDLQYQAKDRSGKLLSKEVPDLSVIINKIVGDT